MPKTIRRYGRAASTTFFAPGVLFDGEGDTAGGGGDGAAGEITDDQASGLLADAIAAGEPPAATTETKPWAEQWDGKVESLPAAARKIIDAARKEAGDERIAKKTLEAIQKALNPDATDKVDPVKLTEQLTTTQAQAKAAALELAIFKAAGTAGANANALTDRRSFMNAVKDLDPAAEDFATKLGEAITTATTADPTLKQSGRAPGASGRELNGGSGEQGQITEEQLKTMSPEQIVDAQNKGLLKHLLGG
jgi:hypothetical protein